MKNWKKIVLVGPILFTLLAGCSSSTEKKGNSSQGEKVIHISTSGELPTADSAKAYDTLSYEQISLFQEGLYALNEENQAEPRIATSLPEISEDGLTYKIQLRSDAKWSNGQAVKAQDFVFAWRRVLDPKTAAQNASIFYILKNGKEANEGQVPLEQVGVEALSDTELRITLAYASDTFTKLLSNVNWFPQNEAFTLEKGDQYGTNSSTVLSNGAFQFSSWDGTGISWEFTKNENYWNANQVSLDKVQVQVVKDIQTGLNLYEGNQLDITKISGDYVSQYSSRPEYKTVKSLQATNLEMGISSNPYLQNEKVRQALLFAVDRQELAKNVLKDGSVAATGIIPDGILQNPSNQQSLASETSGLLTTNKEKAKQLWNEAKTELGVDHIEFVLLTSDTDSAKKIGEYLQGAYESTLPGLKITVNSMPSKNRFSVMMSYDFDLALGGWTGEVDPATYLYQFETEYEHNHGKYSDATYDSYLNNIRSVYNTDPQKRYEEMKTAQAYAIDHAVVIPLVQVSNNYLVNSKLDGVVFHTLGTPYDLSKATFK